VAVGISKRGAVELFAGRKRARLLPTLCIAAIVTAIVALPLILRALDATEAETGDQPLVLAPADSQSILVDTVDSEPAPLDESTVSGPILISLDQPDATAVSFNLFAQGADVAIVESLDLEGPRFDFVVDEGDVVPFDSTVLGNGTYELFVTVRTSTEDRRTAVSFQVENP